ncbi:MAG: sigma-54-dependent Fis family transcriptional regulator [Treponema sp.]|nr:sigma-54-dependent Fis family transcriptional regulator [Treponema sp.]
MRNLEYGNIDSLAGESQFVQELKKISLVLCRNNASVLLKGEKGTGKRQFALLVHLQGKNNPEDFFELNCRVYSPEETKKFLALVAQLPSYDFLGKTIFISDADSLSFELQEELARLLRTVREQRKNIRFIFSTEVNIEDKIEQGLFSNDLYQLMSSVPVNMIPLRQRKDDIIPIASYYFAKLKAVAGVCFEGFSEEAVQVMNDYFWPGNVAELKNAVERAFIVGEPPYIKTSDMALGMAGGSADAVAGDEVDRSLKTAVNAFKKSYVTKILEENNWNQTKAAKILGIQRTYVIRLIDELHIRK